MFDYQLHGMRAAELRSEAERERLARKAAVARRRRGGEEQGGGSGGRRDTAGPRNGKSDGKSGRWVRTA
ncbi:hypothetical protein [Streptomyces megasporus]|uniref:hypothetical protein n=1 Tax=Streptomyces megasporus TaxID=44060 RepID=UPI00056CB61A|nr:hypothetical protein [Streptomyces megasporus]